MPNTLMSEQAPCSSGHVDRLQARRWRCSPRRALLISRSRPSPAEGVRHARRAGAHHRRVRDVLRNHGGSTPFVSSRVSAPGSTPANTRRSRGSRACAPSASPCPSPRRSPPPIVSSLPPGSSHGIHQPPCQRRRGVDALARDRERQAVRCRPMRRTRLTHPPAPGISPKPSSGRRNQVSVARWSPGDRRPQAPHLRRCRRHAAGNPRDGDTRQVLQHGRRVERTACALAGSDAVPNSARSPPAQKSSPSACDHRGLDGGIGRYELERLDQRIVTHLDRVRCVARQPGKSNRQRRAGTLDPEAACPADPTDRTRSRVATHP